MTGATGLVGGATGVVGATGALDTMIAPSVELLLLQFVTVIPIIADDDAPNWIATVCPVADPTIVWGEFTVHKKVLPGCVPDQVTV